MNKSRFILLFSLLLVSVSLSATVKSRNGRKPAAQTDSVAALQDSTLAEDALLKASPRKVGSQAAATLKATGSPVVPVILVQFADKRFISGLNDDTASGAPLVECTTEEDSLKVNAFYDKFCNGEGEEGSYYKGAGSYGAISEYFRDQSLGRFTPKFVVYGPVTLDKGYANYGKNNKATGKDALASTSSFYSEAIKKVQEMNVEWSQFDNNRDDKVDMAFFIFAGPGENADGDENTIWPHERPLGGTQGGIKFGCYACCNETFMDQTDGIGVFIHELSHALGLPDFYDTNYVAYGMDYWDVMDSGCYANDGYTPSNYTAYEREFMGWISLEELDSKVPMHLTLLPIDEGGTAYKILNPENPNEYYVIENRQSRGWDSYVGNGLDNFASTGKEIKMHGLMVTHVDYDKIAWNDNKVNTEAAHQRMAIVPADGDLYSYEDATDTWEHYQAYYNSVVGDLFPGAQQVTQFTGEAAYFNTGTDESRAMMDQLLTDITESEEGVITLNFMGIPTDISNLFANPKYDLPVYTLTGIRVDTTTLEYGKPTNLPSQPGIYIVEGKKYIVK